MMSSLPKRPASASPERDRLSKRQATEEPEEGELEDATPPPPPVAKSPSPSKDGAKPVAKVPFPFKKKAALPEDALGPRNGQGKDRTGLHDDERRHRDREDDAHRLAFSLPQRPWGADRWEPAPNRYERPRREGQSYAPEPRHYARDADRRSYRSPTPPRHTERRPPSRSPSSTRSRSPLTPSSQKEKKHRLPQPRAVLPDPPSTFRGAYESDRWRSDDSSWSRRNGSVNGRYEESWDNRNGRRWEGEANGRSYARANSPEAYVPRSPSPRPTEPSRPISPRTTPPTNGADAHANTPPPPVRPPPPPPPEATSLPPRPAAPSNIHSPRPLPSTLPRQESEIRAAASDASRRDISRDIALKPSIRRPRRKPVHRSREQELEAYGHMFVGCGQQSDYAVLTKLGEGTFGYVLNHARVRVDRLYSIESLTLL